MKYLILLLLLIFAGCKTTNHYYFPEDEEISIWDLDELAEGCDDEEEDCDE